MHQPSRVAIASVPPEQSAGLSLAAAVWALLTAHRPDQIQAASLDGLEVLESTWDEWEELHSGSADSTAKA
ncbi:hypothetical protein LNV09_09550 [Paucibacter sp. B2R-40]|uniref:hypothetical protein n=1 Tax=Paucibacter sp. B2R-40 TaxID=2893554 RepID=UPI0021E37D1E|nr:hypothetical protein [Paucibacter sp. B2R-40]MCV2354408.1 hypothetical protein [Paucibacter sp. B2R-40]